MFEAQVLGLLQRYLGKYVYGLDAESLRISVWRGDVELSNLRLKAEALDELNLPITVKSGLLGRLRLKVCAAGTQAHLPTYPAAASVFVKGGRRGLQAWEQGGGDAHRPQQVHSLHGGFSRPMQAGLMTPLQCPKSAAAACIHPWCVLCALKPCNAGALVQAGHGACGGGV